MPLANSNGPRWIRPQKVAAEKRLQGIAPIRDFLRALLSGQRPKGPAKRDDTLN
jgi:hypothetical protein